MPSQGLRSPLRWQFAEGGGLRALAADAAERQGRIRRMREGEEAERRGGGKGRGCEATQASSFHHPSFEISHTELAERWPLHDWYVSSVAYNHEGDGQRLACEDRPRATYAWTGFCDSRSHVCAWPALGKSGRRIKLSFSANSFRIYFFTRRERTPVTM